MMANGDDDAHAVVKGRRGADDEKAWVSMLFVVAVDEPILVLVLRGVEDLGLELGDDLAASVEQGLAHRGQGHRPPRKHGGGFCLTF